MTLDAIPMDPICPRCDGKHGVEVSGDGYEWDCAACGQHLICAIGPDGGEMFPWGRQDGTCGCNREPHTCDDVDDEPDDDHDASSVEDYTCMADDSTECGCPACVAAKDRFWAEQGEERT